MYSGVKSGRIPAPDDPAVQELCDRIRVCEAELSEREEASERIRTDLEGTGGEEASEILKGPCRRPDPAAPTATSP